MTTALTLAVALPGEVYALGRTMVWAILALIAGCYLRKEVRTLVSEVASLISRITNFKAAGVEIAVTNVPPEDVQGFDEPT